jgi:hypothetical protein
VDEQSAQIAVAFLRDPAKATDIAAGVLSRNQSQEACESPTGRETSGVAYERDQGGGRQETYPRQGPQAADIVVPPADHFEMRLDGLDSNFQFPDLIARFGEGWGERWGNRALFAQPLVDLRNDRPRSGRDRKTQLTKHPSYSVDPRGARRDPSRAKSVESGECLLVDRLDGDGKDLLVPHRFENGFGVSSVGLVSPPVTTDVVSGEKPDIMPDGADSSSPMVGGSAGLKEDGGRFLPGEEGDQSASGQPLPLVDLPWSGGKGDFENGLRNVDGDRRILHFGLLLALVSTRTCEWPGTMMPYWPQGESITSMKNPSSRGILRSSRRGVEHAGTGESAGYGVLHNQC